jgi:hypothetical protein
VSGYALTVKWRIVPTNYADIAHFGYSIFETSQTAYRVVASMKRVLFPILHPKMCHMVHECWVTQEVRGKWYVYCCFAGVDIAVTKLLSYTASSVD